MAHYWPGRTGHVGPVCVSDRTTSQSTQHQYGQQVRRTNCWVFLSWHTSQFICSSWRNQKTRSLWWKVIFSLFGLKERSVLRGDPVHLESAVHQREESHRLAVLSHGHQTDQLPHHNDGKLWINSFEVGLCRLTGITRRCRQHAICDSSEVRTGNQTWT